ncbi:hypothetical protein [Deinococcus peraridilitoris]|uniref:DUF1269 domain-containing protein n=1 Tax=Deinococcus peraridilitoris (strain DSM 19664 / LMG 22246 / CIP 109416 / KR-200) TaxID=937777 RepID=L0A6Q2_DEIPD|nr:hypothetical protein [Deinococcus peraridilitoris]AFZ68700.1 hypothetical protein Deipe_3258 [Deinococcus peraridilitoris DSM 19664]
METVVALFNEPSQARTALSRLLDRGFERDRLGFSLLDVVAQEDLASEIGVSHEEGAPAGAGSVFRGAGLGLLAGVGLALPTWLLMLIIPETRPMHEGGLIGIMFGAISGLGLGAAFGALSGGDHGDYVKLLRRMGVPERIALGYYDGLKRGKVMVIARDQEQERADEATAILKSAGAIELDEGTGGGRLSSERRPHREDRHR